MPGSSPAPSRRTIGVDVGGTAIKGVVLGPDGGHPTVRQWPTPRTADQSELLDTILGCAAELVDAARTDATGSGDPGSDVAAVGIAVPGDVDEERGIARFAANLPLRELPLGRLATARLGLPVAVGHDVRSAARAEAAIGSARGMPDVFVVAVGTGVGGAHFVDGRLRLGHHALAGQLGHVTIRPGGRPCGCGGSGHLGSYASATALVTAYAGESGQRVPARTVLERFLAGDGAAATAWAGVVGALADGLALVVTLLDPGVVVLTGGIAHAGADLTGPLRDALADRLTFQRIPELLPGAFPDFGGAIGVALTARGLLAQRS